MTDDEQRMKNLLMFKMYATDKEIEKLAPIVLCLTIVTVGGIWLFNLLSK